MSGTDFEAIATAVRQVLSVRGPIAEDDLLAVLVADGIDLGPDPLDMLTDILDDDAELVLPLADQRWALIPALLDGRIFTHRLSASEAQHDMIGFGPDLAPLSMLTESHTYQRLTDGSPIADLSPFLDGDILAERGVPETVVGQDGVLLLPPGQFATLGAGAGDLVGLRVTAAGFELAAVAGPATCEIGPALAAVLDAHPDRPEMLDAAVWTACAARDDLFRKPVAPLGELLSAAGLAQEGDWVAHGGFDFGTWRVRGQIESIAARYELDDDEALAVLATVRLYQQTAALVQAVSSAQQDRDAEELLDIVSQLFPPQLGQAPVRRVGRAAGATRGAPSAALAAGQGVRGAR